MNVGATAVRKIKLNSWRSRASSADEITVSDTPLPRAVAIVLPQLRTRTGRAGNHACRLPFVRTRLEQSKQRKGRNIKSASFQYGWERDRTYRHPVNLLASQKFRLMTPRSPPRSLFLPAIWTFSYVRPSCFFFFFSLLPLHRSLCLPKSWRERAQP